MFCSVGCKCKLPMQLPGCAFKGKGHVLQGPFVFTTYGNVDAASHLGQ